MKMKIKQFLMSSDERNQYLGLRLAIQTGMHISEIADIVFNYGWTYTKMSQSHFAITNAWEKEFLGYKFSGGYYPEYDWPTAVGNPEMFTMFVYKPGHKVNKDRASYICRFYPEVKKPRYQIMDIKQMSIDVLTEIINSL